MTKIKEVSFDLFFLSEYFKTMLALMSTLIGVVNLQVETLNSPNNLLAH